MRSVSHVSVRTGTPAIPRCLHIFSDSGKEERRHATVVRPRGGKSSSCSSFDSNYPDREGSRTRTRRMNRSQGLGGFLNAMTAFSTTQDKWC